jgi:hypothetical protein
MCNKGVEVHNEEIHDLYSSRSIEKNKVCWAERRGVYRVLVGNLRERNHLGDPGVDGRIILRSLASGMCVYGLDRAGSG